MTYAYVWRVIGGAQLLVGALIVALVLIRRSRNRSRLRSHAVAEAVSHQGHDASNRANVHRWARSRFWWRRLQAARSLADIATAVDRAVIQRLLLDPHPGVQSAAASSLLRYADDGLVATVIDTLAARSAAVRVYQCNVLRQHVTLAAPLVLARLRADAPPAKLYSYIFLAQTLRAPECMDRVAALSIHQHPEVRVAVARALHAAPGEMGTIKLLTMLRDPDWRVRAQAARGLGAVGEERAIPELARALTDPTWWVRFRAALALAALGDPGRKALEGAFTRPDRYARDMAAFVYALSPSSIAELSEG